MKPKNTICLWFDKDAQEVARSYAATFPDNKVKAVHEARSDFPGGKKGDVLTVEFTLVGIPCLGLNGGPTFKPTAAFSFQKRRTIRKRRTVTGTRSLATVERRAHAVGAKTDGASLGR
jgi:predicted 3-demethylubiquinone-9 3-methyltransferase (glyoxalase superfamily)